MPRFFWQIRRRLLTENRFSKYLLYATGEILLVVIGILIAIQIDDWQTKNDSLQQERRLLLGIKEDLMADTLQVSRRFMVSYEDFKNNIRLFDSLRTVDDINLNVHYVDSIFARCIRQRNTFFPVAGTYKTIINNSLSEKIRNRDLFKQIQSLYEKQYVALEKNGDRMDELSDRIRYDNRDLMSLPEVERLAFYKTSSSRNDVEIWRKRVDNFARYLLQTRERDISSVLNSIDRELKHK